MIAKHITFFGQSCILICDARCDKAWGISQRPRKADWVWVSDNNLTSAPADPGTYEGGEGKPQCPAERLNKWCARECERSIIVKDNEEFSLYDFKEDDHE